MIRSAGVVYVFCLDVWGEGVQQFLANLSLKHPPHPIKKCDLLYFSSWKAVLNKIPPRSSLISFSLAFKASPLPFKAPFSPLETPFLVLLFI